MNNMNGFATDTTAKRGKGLIVAAIVLLLLATLAVTLCVSKEEGRWLRQ